MVTISRRTPNPLREAVKALAAETGGFLWDGSGDNPYVAMLALAEAIVVTSDSANMVSEAVSTGAPVLLFDLPSTSQKIRRASGRDAAITPWSSASSRSPGPRARRRSGSRADSARRDRPWASPVIQTGAA
ncbi:ELM1/GtrOC1 family putative glycosyltransferase [Methylobacterium mesophilicum]|uniref:ELM1/GtrOC1 family putative glycosyltransferase n=1 Tax=Methylobacterium mesophilicum TaxID=39956 RepID=UPI002F356000